MDETLRSVLLTSYGVLVGALLSHWFTCYGRASERRRQFRARVCQGVLARIRGEEDIGPRLDDLQSNTELRVLALDVRPDIAWHQRRRFRNLCDELWGDRAFRAEVPREQQYERGGRAFQALLDCAR